MSSRARDIVSDVGKASWYNWFGGVYASIATNAPTYGRTFYACAKQVGWFVVTTGMITAMPLIFETKRESLLDEMERMQIGAGLSEGKTPQELLQSGLTGAIAPSVLK